MEILLKFYTMTFSLVRKIFPNKKSKLFNFHACSVLYNFPARDVSLVNLL